MESHAFFGGKSYRTIWLCTCLYLITAKENFNFKENMLIT